MQKSDRLWTFLYVESIKSSHNVKRTTKDQDICSDSESSVPLIQEIAGCKKWAAVKNNNERLYWSAHHGDQRPPDGHRTQGQPTKFRHLNQSLDAAQPPERKVKPPTGPYLHTPHEGCRWSRCSPLITAHVQPSVGAEGAAISGHPWWQWWPRSYNNKIKCVIW